MSFFYDLNKKLDGIRATPEVTHQQLNERDMGKHNNGKTTGFKAVADKAAKEYGSKAAGERVAGAVKAKMAKAGKLEEEQVDEVVRAGSIVNPNLGILARPQTQQDRDSLAWAVKRGRESNRMPGTDNDIHPSSGAKSGGGLGRTYTTNTNTDATRTFSGRPTGSHKVTIKSQPKTWQQGEPTANDGKGLEEGPIDAIKKVGKKVASGVNKLVGHGSDEDMIKDLQRKSGAPVTGKKPQNFADKIAGAKKEVDEMLGDVAAEAMRSALSGGQKKLDKNHNGKLDANDFAMLRKGAKPKSSGEMDEDNAFDYKSPRDAAPKVGSVERGHKHDIKHTATGRMVTRRTDDQGNSVGADDDSDTQAGPRGRGRPKGTKGSIGAKGPSGKSKLMTREGDNESSELKAAMALLKKSGYKVTKAEGEEELDEKAVSKKQQKFMGMVHATQKGEKAPSKEVAKVAKTMKPKDAEDFASTKHKGLPEKAPKKKKEEEVEESSTTAGAVATSTATKGSKGGVFGKGIYDSMNFELEQMIAESMSINMSDSTEGNKSLTVTATDEDAMKLAVMLKSAGLGGQGRELQSDSHEHEEPCETCGMQDCGCGDVHEAVDENAPDWPTNTETSDDALQYSGGLNKPKTDVAGDGQTTIPNTAVHTQEEDALRRMMEMAGLAEAAKPDFLDMDKDGDKEESMKKAIKDKEEDSVEESIQRMRAIAGIKEAKKPDFLDMDKDGDKKEPMSKAIKDKEEKKVEESIFALTNQWKAYRG